MKTKSERLGEHAELANKVEAMMKALIDKHDCRMEGEKLLPDIYIARDGSEPGSVELSFDDEYMGYLLAGYVSCTVYDEMEEGFKALGLEIIDGDGSNVTVKEVA